MLVPAKVTSFSFIDCSALVKNLSFKPVCLVTTVTSPAHLLVLMLQLLWNYKLYIYFPNSNSVFLVPQ